MRVLIDRARCVGAGQCVRVAPEVFDQDPQDGLVVLVDAAPPAHPGAYFEMHLETHLEACVRRAVQLCPAQAIRLDPG